MNWEDKVWGQTRCVEETEFYSRHELLVIAGGYCSLHHHEYRANKFTVLNGRIAVVQVMANDVHEIILSQGDIFDVPSLVPHMFKVIEPGNVVEEYYPDRGGKVWSADIHRYFEGGMVPVEDLDAIPRLQLLWAA